MEKQNSKDNPEKNTNSGILKNIAVLIVVISAIGLGYYFLNQPPAEIKYDIGEKVDSSVFTEGLKGSNKVFIVMDIRNITSDKQKGNIMQCGTDFAGSDGLVEKELIVYAIEGNNCMNINSTSLKVTDCLKEAISNFAIFITGGSSTKFMQKRAIVGVEEEYQVGSCKVNLKYE